MAKSKARFKLCDCGKHGRLLGDDGFSSVEFVCKDEARYNLATAKHHGTISHAMIEVIRRQIEAADLPEYREGADPELLKQVIAFNHLRVGAVMANDQDLFDPEKFHEHQPS